ncbi:MAG: hypothetical protein K0Q79_796 [Flavipsychrobacter sp.]|jgi:sugar lactone lactonase YvrE|nr:hypothetical protein [Flavipsychrobacter sp.]
MKGLLFIWVLLLPVLGMGQIITTIAGNGSSGYSGDGGYATAATFSQPSQILVDKFDNIYVAGGLNFRVRKINSLGVITTIAGNGVAGYNGDGIPATDSKLNGLSDISFDVHGNLHIADGFNHRIRKVDATTGIITTVAGNGVLGFSGDGGAATNASLNYPGHITFDSDGNLYISDVENRRIRKVNILGVISTIAGNGILGYSGDGGLATLAEINSPHGLTCDSSGSLYFSDAGNGRVRKVDRNTGIITTFAGNGTFTYNGDGISATVAEVTPQGLAFDRYGNLYIADAEGLTVGNRIRKVDVNGTIHTVAGCGINGFSGDGGLATLAKLYSPWDIAFDTCGNFYIADANNQRIRKVTYPHCHYLGITEQHIQSVTSIYPNPTNEELTIENVQPNTTYQLCNIVGSVVQYGSLKEGGNTISIAQLPPGMYLLALTDEQGRRVVHKVVKE